MEIKYHNSIPEDIKNKDKILSKVFYDIEESLRNIKIVSKEDILEFYRILCWIGEQISNDFFDHTKEVSKADQVKKILQWCKKKKKDNSPNTYDDEKEKKGNGSLTDYLFHARGNLSYGIRTFEPASRWVNIPLSLQDIYVNNMGSNNKWTCILDSLENIFSGEDKNLQQEIIFALEEIRIKITDKIRYAIDQETNRAKNIQQEIKQDILEEKVNSEITKLLSQKNDNQETIIIHTDTLANQEDFKEWFADVYTIIGNTYAENIDFFSNTFLGFDIEKWWFQTRKDKTIQYNDIFLEKKDGERDPTHRKILWLGTSTNLPIIAKSISTSIIQNLTEHTRPLIQRSPEEKVIHDIKEYRYLQEKWLTSNEIEKIYEITLTRRHKAKDEEQKKAILSKTYEQIRNITSHRKYRITISWNMPANAKTHIIENIAKIHPDYKDYWGNITRIGQEKIEAMPDIRKEIIINAHKTANDKKKKIWHETFGPNFDLEKLLEEPSFQQDFNFYWGSRNWNRALGMALKDRCSQEGKKLEDTLAFLKKLEKVEKEEKIQIKKITEMYLFNDDIQKLLWLEKDISQEFWSVFERTESSIEEVLTKFITKKFETYILSRKADFELAKGIIDLINKFKIATKKKINNILFQKILENIQVEIDNIILFEEFQYIVKTLKITPTYNMQHRQKVFQKELEKYQYEIGCFHIYNINLIEDIKIYAQELGIQLKLPKHPPLEEFYIHRLRTPENFDDKTSNENFFDRYSWTIWYEKDNLASIYNIECFLKEMWSKITRSDVLDIDIRNYREINEKDQFDIKEIVPISVNFPKVEVQGYGIYDKKGQMWWYYVLAFDTEKKIFNLIFDSTLIHGDMIIQKYNLAREHITIMWWGWLEVDRNNTTLLIKDKIDTYHHEPRIITLTAFYNAFKNQQLDYKIFIGKDWFVKSGDYY